MNFQSYVISGAGSGIGKAIAFKIATIDPLSKLYLLGRNTDRLEAVRRELPRSENHTILGIDLQDRNSIKQGIQSLNLKSMNLTAVVANAGVGGGNKYGPSDRWDEVIAINLTGTYCLVQECLPALQESKNSYKNIVVVSSILARLGVPGYSAYCASKAGLLGLTRSWAAEYAQNKILVNAICPGWVDTPMASKGLQTMSDNLGSNIDEIRKIEMSRVPLGKMAEPREVAELVSFLVFGNQTSMTGQCIDINNGALMA